MASVNKWKHHFQMMANKTLATSDIFTVKGKNKGPGRQSFGSAMYKIRPMETSKKAITGIISPAAEAVAQANQMVENTKHATKTVKKRKKRAVGNETYAKKVVKQEKSKVKHPNNKKKTTSKKKRIKGVKH